MQIIFQNLVNWKASWYYSAKDENNKEDVKPFLQFNITQVKNSKSTTNF